MTAGANTISAIAILSKRREVVRPSGARADPVDEGQSCREIACRPPHARAVDRDEYDHAVDGSFAEHQVDAEQRAREHQQDPLPKRRRHHAYTKHELHAW